MNATYIALGALFLILGAGAFARAGKAGDATAAKNARLAGVLMMATSLIFMATAVVAAGK